MVAQQVITISYRATATTLEGDHDYEDHDYGDQDLSELRYQKS